jgi:FtsH-binding integral membrane protein
MDEKEILRARLKSVPRGVFLSVLFLTAFVGLNAIRILLTYQQQGNSLLRGFFYASLIAMVFITQALSLLNKSKASYLAIVIFSLLPAFGSFALSVHALRLLVTGEWALYQFEMVISVIGVLQFVALTAVETTLLQRDVRDWVWKEPAAEPLTT